MADVDFSIEVAAEGVGTDATAEQVEALGESIEAAEKVLTPFDSALERTAGLLDEAASAAETANSALSSAEAEYKRLERAATRAGKAVERASAKGKDTTALQASADSAAAAVKRQGVAVDQARAKATAAAAAENRLAASYKKISAAAGAAAAKTKALGRAQKGASKSGVGLGSTIQAVSPLLGSMGGRLGQVTQLIGQAGFVGVVLLAVIATVALAGAVVYLGAKMLLFAIAADKATSKKLSAAWKQAGKDAKTLFEGVNTDKLVKPAESMLQILDKNTSAGKGLSKIFETLLNPVIDGLVKAAPLAKEFIKGLILGALRAIIFMLRLRNAVAKAIPRETREKIKKLVAGIFSLENAAKAGEEAFDAFFLPIRMFAVLASEAGLKALWLADVLEGIWDDLSSDEFQAWMLGVLNDIADWADDMASDATSAAADFVDGIAQGLLDGVGAIADAAKKLGSAAMDAIKSVTESGSPSKVMVRWGRDDFAGAIAMGQEEGEKDVRRASRKLGEASVEGVRLESARKLPSPGARAAPGGNGRSGQATITVTFSDGAIVINAPSGDSGELAQEVRRVLLEEIDGAALQLGGGELVAGTT